MISIFQVLRNLRGEIQSEMSPLPPRKRKLLHKPAFGQPENPFQTFVRFGPQPLTPMSGIPPVPISTGSLSNPAPYFPLSTSGNLVSDNSVSEDSCSVGSSKNLLQAEINIFRFVKPPYSVAGLSGKVLDLVLKNLKS